MSERYQQLSYAQLQGAEYALRILRTSVVIRGRALEILDEQLLEVREEMNIKFETLMSGGKDEDN